VGNEEKWRFGEHEVANACIRRDVLHLLFRNLEPAFLPFGHQSFRYQGYLLRLTDRVHTLKGIVLGAAGSEL
jgi:hypothetical protein